MCAGQGAGDTEGKAGCLEARVTQQEQGRSRSARGADLMKCLCRWWLWSLWAPGMKVGSSGLSYEAREKLRSDPVFQCMDETVERRNLGM